MKLHLLSLVALHAVAADRFDDVVSEAAKIVEEAGITPDECSPGPPGVRRRHGPEYVGGRRADDAVRRDRPSVLGK